MVKKAVSKKDNQFKVSKTEWKKWSPATRLMFEDMFSLMRDNQTLFTHPETSRISEKQWETVAWNAAWMAAQNMQGMLGELRVSGDLR